MRIRYKTIKKIHLYACLSTAAILFMFIVTSYVMIYHDQFDHESTEQTDMLDYDATSYSEEELQNWVVRHNVPGRKEKSYENRAGHPVIEYRSASTHTRLTFITTSDQVEVIQTKKSKADALVGVHRNKGYGGGIVYNIYAFSLDVLGVSLILFTVTGIYMWMKLLKGNRWAWFILVGGLVYFCSVWVYLAYS